MVFVQPNAFHAFPPPSNHPDPDVERNVGVFFILLSFNRKGMVVRVEMFIFL